MLASSSGCAKPAVFAMKGRRLRCLQQTCTWRGAWGSTKLGILFCGPNNED